MIHQSASAVILVRPSGFGYDPVTAESNGFQHQVTDADLRQRAGAEFDALLDALRHCGIRTTVLDPADPAAPNGVFPNNWFSTHPHGTIVLYPMCAATRRSERDPALRSALEREGFHVQQVLDLSSWEQRGLFLEGTGSVVIDRLHQRAYACISPRTSEPALNAW
nr:arginine deiminase-related protein [Flavobacteriales bacterium]